MGSPAKMKGYAYLTVVDVMTGSKCPLVIPYNARGEKLLLPRFLLEAQQLEKSSCLLSAIPVGDRGAWEPGMCDPTPPFLFSWGSAPPLLCFISEQVGHRQPCRSDSADALVLGFPMTRSYRPQSPKSTGTAGEFSLSICLNLAVVSSLVLNLRTKHECNLLSCLKW